MEITSFILGVCAVVVVTMIVGTFVNFMSFKTLKRDFNGLVVDLNDTNRELRLKEEQIIHYVDKLHNNHDGEMNKLYGYVDSRTDKLEAKMYKEFDLYRKQGKNY